MRFEKEINIYGDEAVLKRFQANETSIAVVQGKLSALISESELIELENSQSTMYSKLASAIMDIDSLTLNFSDLTTKYNTVSGQYTSLDSKVAEYKASVDGLSADITAVEQNISKNYSTTTQMNAAITAKANEITAELSAVKTTLQNDYSTTTAMQSFIDMRINQFSVSVSSTYAKKSDLNTANGKIEDLESWKNEASLKITDSAIISTVTESSTYAASVNSLIEQKASSIRLKATTISWSSTYSSMTSNGTLTCRNATIEGTIHSDNGDDEIYMRSARLDFIRDGIDVGNIGTNVNTNNSAQKGLTFDLDYTGHFMSWGVEKTASASTYSMVWAYARTALAGAGGYQANTLNAGCDIDMHYYTLKNVDWPNGGVTRTINYVQVLKMNDDGTVQEWGANGRMVFENGILTDLTYYEAS